MSQIVADVGVADTSWTEVRRGGLRWRLDLGKFVDREIFEHGCYEMRTTDIVWEWVKPGMKVLDVGANFGYFTTVLAELVGPGGHVWAVEPTRMYGERIRWHLDANGFSERATVLKFGLSDRDEERTIEIVDSSASLHLPERGAVAGSETISLRRLDDLNLPGVDFIKVDIDGHEPFFIRGGQGYLRKHQPAMLLEFAWQYLETAGTDIWEMKAQLEELGYELYSEATLARIQTREQFAAEAGDQKQSSVNLWAFAKGRGPAYLPTLAARRIREAIAELSASLGRAAEVWLFGAGQHTAKAMAGMDGWKDAGRVSAIVDDNPKFAGGKGFLGLPVFDRRAAEGRIEAGARVDAILLSTDTHQEKFFELTAGLRQRGLRAVKLYS